MVKIYPNEINLFQLAAIARTPGIRTGTTPFGMPPGMAVRYIGKSVDWKGFKKSPYETLEEYLRRFAETFKKPVRGRPTETVGAAIADGLRKAIDVSKAAAGTYGVAVVALADGRHVVLPRKVVRQMEMQGKPVTVVAEKVYDVPAKEVRKRYGIKGEYKALVPMVTGRAAIAPIPG